MNESNPSDDALAELLSLTVEVTRFGSTTYRNHLGQEHRVHAQPLSIQMGMSGGIRMDYGTEQMALQSYAPAVNTGS